MNIVKQLQDPLLRSRKAFVGFDGYVDSLYRVIKSRRGDQCLPFSTITEFATELASRAGKSGGMELQRISVQAGGNAVLMAQGLTALDIKTCCAANMGLGVLHPAFVALKESGCELISTGEAASTLATEFEDGKFMFNDSMPFENLDWKTLQQNCDAAMLVDRAAGADLVALVDWANMPAGTDLWRGLLDALPPSLERQRIIFFDLADISRQDPVEVMDVVGLIERAGEKGRVALGLNENEAMKLAMKLDLRPGHDSLEAVTTDLAGRIKVDWLVVHPRDRALIVEKDQLEVVSGLVVKKPVLSTGGGDHFNAGFCCGLLHGLNSTEAARLATIVSGDYVGTGRSPEIERVISLVQGRS